MNAYQLYESHHQKLRHFSGYIAAKYHYKTYMGHEDFCQIGCMKVWETLLEQPECTTSYLRDRIHSGIFAAYKRGKSLDNDYQNIHRRAEPVSVARINDEIPEHLIADRRLSTEDKAIEKIMFERFIMSLSPIEEKLVKLKIKGFKNKEIAEKIRRGTKKVAEMLKSIRKRFDTIYGLA